MAKKQAEIVEHVPPEEELNPPIENPFDGNDELEETAPSNDAETEADAPEETPLPPAAEGENEGEFSDDEEDWPDIDEDADLGDAPRRTAMQILDDLIGNPNVSIPEGTLAEVLALREVEEVKSSISELIEKKRSALRDAHHYKQQAKDKNDRAKALEEEILELNQKLTNPSGQYDLIDLANAHAEFLAQKAALLSENANAHSLLFWPEAATETGMWEVYRTLEEKESATAEDIARAIKFFRETNKPHRYTEGRGKHLDSIHSDVQKRDRSSTQFDFKNALGKLEKQHPRVYKIVLSTTEELDKATVAPADVEIAAEFVQKHEGRGRFANGLPELLASLTADEPATA